MQYENRQLPEHVNYATENPLREFAILLAGALALVAVLVVALSVSASWLAKKIPFSVEQGWALEFAKRLPARAPDEMRDAAEASLQQLVDRVAQVQGLPEDMPLRVHLLEDSEVNAFATLGGHLLVTRGILEKLPHENALVLLLGHEAAHVKHRDPMVALGRSVAVSAALSVLVGLDHGVGSSMQKAGLLTLLTFNRHQESAADEEALRTLAGWYGHTAGATALYTVLQQSSAGLEPPVFLSTPPASADRLAKMQARETAGETTAMPAEITAWVRRAAPVPADQPESAVSAD